LEFRTIAFLAAWDIRARKQFSIPAVAVGI